MRQQPLQLASIYLPHLIFKTHCNTHYTSCESDAKLAFHDRIVSYLLYFIKYRVPTLNSLGVENHSKMYSIQSKPLSLFIKGTHVSICVCILKVKF